MIEILKIGKKVQHQIAFCTNEIKYLKLNYTAKNGLYR